MNSADWRVLYWTRQRSIMTLATSYAIGTAGVRAALNADHATGQIDQDGYEGRASRTVRNIPTGRGGSAAESLRRGLDADTTIRCDHAEASTDMMGVNRSPCQQTPGSL